MDIYTFLHLFFFFFNDTATTEIYTLSLHDALPICKNVRVEGFSVWRIEDGRAIEAWGLVDIAGLMRQLKA